MLRKKKIIVLCVLCGLVGGCGTSSSERVAAVKNAVNQAMVVSQAIDAGTAELEKVIADSRQLLLDPNVPAEMKPAIQKILDETSIRLAKLKLEKQKVSTVLAQYQAILGTIDINNVTIDQETQLYATGIGQLAPLLPPPYGTYIAFGAAVLTLLGSVLKNINQGKEINKGKTVLTDVITSVDSLLSSPVVTSADAAKQVLQKNQTGITQDIVDAIHDPLQNTGPTK